jgi:hypothetical protein
MERGTAARPSGPYVPGHRHPDLPPSQTGPGSGVFYASVVEISLSDFLGKRGFGDNLGAVTTTAPGFLHFEMQLRRTWECSEKIQQVTPEDESALPAFAGLQGTFCDGFVNFGAANSGHCAGFRHRKSFAL